MKRGAKVQMEMGGKNPLVVMPDECQSIPMTAPSDWNQNGCARRRIISSGP